MFRALGVYNFGTAPNDVIASSWKKDIENVAVVMSLRPFLIRDDFSK